MTEQNETGSPREWLSMTAGVFLLAALIIAWIVYAGRDGKTEPKQRAATEITTKTERSCEAWREAHVTLAHNQFDTLRVEQGSGPWVIRLAIHEPSGWIRIDPHVKWELESIHSSLLRFADGLEFTHVPKRKIDVGSRRTFRAKGMGCIRVSTFQ